MDASDKKAGSFTIKLSEPIEWGKDAPAIEELVLKATSRAYKEFAIPHTAEGGVIYQPYELAKTGLRMAGHPPAMVDKLSVTDMKELAQAVMAFLS